MPSTVYFIDLRAKYKENFLSKLGNLLQSAGLSKAIKKRDLVADKAAVYDADKGKELSYEKTNTLDKPWGERAF